MYRAYYNIIRLKEEVTSQDAREVELADVYSNIFPLMKEDREYFGLIDSQGTVLQAMYDEDEDQYWFEVPRPDLKGSFGSNLSFDAAMDLIKSLDGLFPKEGFEGFEFQAW
ncbi:MAG: hypothetical protein ACR2RD_16605 [Woeseiaceae bacterium]